MQTFLNQNEIERKAPSVFTNESFHTTSDKYKLISTWDVLNGLFDLGFGVTHAMESRVRVKAKEGFSKHMLRLRRNGEKEINGLYPELVLINSHDGSTSYQLRAGIYRMVCANGMVVGDEMLARRVRHQGGAVESVVEAGQEIIEIFPEAINTASEWSGIELSPQERNVYAESVKMLKWDDETHFVEAEHLLIPKRTVDRKTDLWTTFNVCQEHLIKGGIRTRNKETGGRIRSRAVKSPAENNRLNTALWNLTERMASLVK